MSQNFEIITKWKDKKYLLDFLVLFTFLITMLTTFLLCVVNGQPNLIAFLIVVIACFSVITIFLAKHIYVGLVMMVIGGLFGFFTDFWGVGNNLWLYNENSITLWVMNGGDLNNGGFPFEIVASYFFASMWIMQVIESLFDTEIADLTQKFAGGEKLVRSYKQFVPTVALLIISIIVIIIEPMYWQPLIYFTIGIFTMSLVPGNKKIISIIFGLIMGFSGFFFELFCSGQILPNALIWTYQQPSWDAFVIPSPRILGAPISAVYAYFGVGSALASSFLILLRIPLFRKEISILSTFKK